LRTELKVALDARDYGRVASIAQKLEKFGNIEPPKQEKTELDTAVDEFIVGNKIEKEDDQLHFRERARRFSAKNGDLSTENIIEALQKEYDDALINKPVADAGWVGHHRNHKAI